MLGLARLFVMPELIGHLGVRVMDTRMRGYDRGWRRRAWG